MSNGSPPCPACGAAVPSGADACPSCGLGFNVSPVPEVNVGKTSLIGVPDLSERHYLARAADSERPVAKIGLLLLLFMMIGVPFLIICAGVLLGS